MATLQAYLASLPPEHTVSVLVLGALTPAFVLILAGFAFCHAADVAAARSWGR